MRGPRNPREAEAYFNSPWVKAQMKRQVEQTLAEIRKAADWEVYVRERNPIELIHRGTQVLWIVDQAAAACGIDLQEPDVRIMAGAVRALSDLAANTSRAEELRPAIQSGMAAADRLWPRLVIWALAEAEMRYHRKVVTEGLVLTDFRYFAHLKSGVRPPALPI